jgi:hypothetical protein
MDEKEAVRVGESDFAIVLDIREPVGALMIGSQAFVKTNEKKAYVGFSGNPEHTAACFSELGHATRNPNRP